MYSYNEYSLSSMVVVNGFRKKLLLLQQPSHLSIIFLHSLDYQTFSSPRGSSYEKIWYCIPLHKTIRSQILSPIIFLNFQIINQFSLCLLQSCPICTSEKFFKQPLCYSNNVLLNNQFLKISLSFFFLLKTNRITLVLFIFYFKFMNISALVKELQEFSTTSLNPSVSTQNIMNLKSILNGSSWALQANSIGA